MTDPHPTDPIFSVLAAADELGVELDEAEAREWISAVSRQASGPLVVDVDTGIYGHHITMSDLDQSEIGRFRHLASIVGLEDRPPAIVTALALSGSAAQNRVHRFPGDCDFFERVHIRADTRSEACSLLADLIRDKALATLRGPGYRLQEVKFGSWPCDAVVAGDDISTGSPVSWPPEAIEKGAIDFLTADRESGSLTWEEAGAEPGWCKLDWLAADPGHGGVANASNMLDATWESPDGTIIPLDGFLDPYFQEVYLDVDSIPLFSRLVKDMGADSVAEYVERLTGEVYKYTVEKPNYGKAARRMYNIFRLTGRYAEAAYLRELFDEPTTALYQLAAMLRAVHEASEGDDTFSQEALLGQVDQLIMSAVDALEGPAEAQMVKRLLELRDILTAEEPTGISDHIARARADAMTEVDDYFQRALVGIPGIKEYMDEVAAAAPPDPHA
ncbi:MAG TPA: hypothetical protein VLB85_09065 [Acidimicrobiia bacterium]|nr:hypothetical protein [Acidimicrobiia bacterium]